MTDIRYNYYEAVADDIREYINNEINLDEWRGDRDGLYEKLYDDLNDPEYLLKDGAEAADVTIRCYVLGAALSEVLDELEENGEFEEPDEDENT